MAPQDKLKYIEYNIHCKHPYQEYPILAMDDTEWLIKRVKQLEEALKYYAEGPYETEDWYYNGEGEVGRMVDNTDFQKAKDTLEEMP